MPRPEVGRPLPRAEDAFSVSEKWADWILAEHGHGRQWTKVFRATPADADRLFAAFRDAIVLAEVSKVDTLFEVQLVCEVEFVLTFNGRTARVRTSWHYADETQAPRLVTAFPRL